MLKIMTTRFRFWQVFDGTLLTLCLSYPELVSFGISLLILLAVDVLKERKINVVDGIMRQGIVTRWLIYFALFFYILIFGIYGPLYDSAQFIYFQF